MGNGTPNKKIMETLKFDTNRKRIEKCPCCGHSNKSLGYVPFIGTDAGYCNYCGQSCFPDKDGTLTDHSVIRELLKEKKVKPPSYHPESLIKKSFKNHNEIDFVKFLMGQFGSEITIDLIKKFRLGCSFKNNGNVIFWQIDIDKKIRAGKIMEYDHKTGKRKNIPRWVHESEEDYNLVQCFFGEQHIKANKPIAIVESEKTAIIMSIKNPAYIWLACGGEKHLTKEKCKVLLGMSDITLYPDQGKYDSWNELRLKCDLYGSKISKDCEFWNKAGLIPEKGDIADYYLNKHSLTDYEIVKTDPDWEEFVLDNPHLNLDL